MHKSVLLEESIAALQIKEDGTYVDCTLGYAGHSSQILKRIKKGFLFAFDQDQEAILASEKKLAGIGSNYKIIYANFKDLKKNINTEVDGILYDLGVSSPQLDEADRGFSFHQDARLDMRMDQNRPLSAYEVVNGYSEQELKRILFVYGEEKYASRIARNIVMKRNEQAIETTLQLTEIIKEAVPEKYRRQTHPSRRSFQAIRIEVNNELENLKISLTDGLDLLKIGGRMIVITFHSLEDRICADIFKKVSMVASEYKDLPFVPEDKLPKFKIHKKIIPSDDEINENSRSRSAKMRIIERIR